MPRVIWTKPEFEPQFLDFPPTSALPIATHYVGESWGRVYGACVSRRGKAFTSLLGQAFCSSATAWSFLPDPGRSLFRDLRLMMALIGRERKDMSTEGKTQALAPVCMEVMLSAGMDRGWAAQPGVGSPGGIISYMTQVRDTGSAYLSPIHFFRSIITMIPISHDTFMRAE